MPSHDVECTKCGLVIENYYVSPWPSTLLHDDGGELQILWHGSSSRSAAVHPRERTVVYRNPLTGDVSYPGRNDTPMPQRYRDAGYERVEFEHTRDRERFEKANNVACEQGWYNSGNGA